MFLHAVTPMIWTAEMQTSIDFYTHILHFQLDSVSADLSWAHMHRDNVSIMLALPNSHENFDKTITRGTIYFYTEEVEMFWEKLKNSSHVYYPMEDFDYGMREFAIKDNNGIILQFGKEINAS